MKPWCPKDCPCRKLQPGAWISGLLYFRIETLPYVNAPWLFEYREILGR